MNSLAHRERVRGHHPRVRPLRDSTAVRNCFIELQNYERQLDRGKPEGSTSADAYLNRMFARCREWEGQVFVAEVADQVVGFVCVWARVKPDEPDDDPSEYAFVSDLFVAPTFRRRGIGRQLLSAAECYALAGGARSLCIGVTAGNAEARRLYGSAGFEEYKVALAKATRLSRIGLGNGLSQQVTGAAILGFRDPKFFRAASTAELPRLAVVRGENGLD